MDELKRRLANLLAIKSILTLLLTGVFAYQAVTGAISQEVMTVFTMVVGFYFGTQASKDKG